MKWNPQIISKCCEHFPEYWWATFTLHDARISVFWLYNVLYCTQRFHHLQTTLCYFYLRNIFQHEFLVLLFTLGAKNCCQVVKLKFHTKSRIIDNIFLAWNLFSFKSKIFGYICLWYLKQISLHKLIFNSLIAVAKSFIV